MFAPAMLKSFRRLWSMQCSGALWLWLWSLSAAVCPYDMYQCDDGQCVMAWPCDGDNDCADGSDERNCGTYSTVFYISLSVDKNIPK